MFSRVNISRIIPTAFGMLRIVNARNSKVTHSFSRLGISANCKNGFLPRRLFAQQANIEELVADYEYVKKATDSDTVLIVDVREPEEVKEHGKIPNSINIPLGNVSTVLGTMSNNEFLQIYNRTKPVENTEIIFYCMIGKRSGKAQQNAINLGYKNTKNYLGSWTDWANKRQ